MLKKNLSDRECAQISGLRTTEYQAIVREGKSTAEYKIFEIMHSLEKYEN